ncbi:MAG: NAD(+) synthase [Clostridia bacterium]|nr:NAD(+) synthase [Clostridia bacterium]
MGCHRGGGDWNKVNQIIEEVFSDYPGTVLICEYNGEPKPFDPVQVKNDLVDWIRKWFAENGPDCSAVVGLSGGKDSTVVAALCKEALGKDRVIGVMMPNGVQSDIADAKWAADFLDIKAVEINIASMISAINGNILYGIYNQESYAAISENEALREFWGSVTETNQSRINLPPRIRMTTLYAIAQMLPTGGRVANTCNLSEDHIGYSTRWGDSVGDFAPLANLTSEEVVAIGDVLGLPEELTHKTPSDGLCGKTDEDNFGFTYAVLNKYIRTGICEDKVIKAKIDALHQRNLFKLKPIPAFPYKVAA